MKKAGLRKVISSKYSAGKCEVTQNRGHFNDVHLDDISPNYALQQINEATFWTEFGVYHFVHRRKKLPLDFILAYNYIRRFRKFSHMEIKYAYN